MKHRYPITKEQYLALRDRIRAGDRTADAVADLIQFTEQLLAVAGPSPAVKRRVPRVKPKRSAKAD